MLYVTYSRYFTADFYFILFIGNETTREGKEDDNGKKIYVYVLMAILMINYISIAFVIIYITEVCTVARTDDG